MKISIRKILYIITIIIMCGFKFVSIPYMVKYAIGFLWIIYAFSKKSNDITKDGMRITKLFYYPYIVIFCVSPLLMLVSPVADVSIVESITRMVSLLMQTTVALFFAYASFRMFGIGAVNNMFYGLVANNLVGVLWAVYKFGMGQFIQFIVNPFDDIWNTYILGGRISNALELHEVTLALGLYFIYFAFYKESDVYSAKKNSYGRLIVTVALLYIGFKRILLLALFAMFLTTILIGRKKKKKSFQYASNIVYLGTLCVMWLYLFIISTDILAILGVKYNINFMSRLEWFNALKNYYSFDILYLGKGWGVLSRIVDFLKQGVHNDILRNYIEFGFLGFFLWMTYVLRIIPKKIEKKDLSVAKLYLYLIVYTMVTYMTDNTFNYIIFQASTLVIVLVAMQENKLKSLHYLE